MEYIPLRSRQRLFHGNLSSFSVWHTLHQHVKERPPLRAGHRLVTLHDLNYLYGPKGSNWTHSQELMEKIAARTDGIVTISQHVAEDVRRHLNWTAPLKVVYNGARSLVDHPREQIPEVAGKPFFFHLSRMAPSKNIDALLGLAIEMRDQRFVLAGPSSDDTERVKGLVRGLSLRNVLVYEDITDAQKTWLYENAQAFLFPSLTEGFGLPPIEAMHFGCPVFLARRTCLPEIGGEAAAYWDEFDSLAMRAVVERELPRLASDEGRARTRAHAARFDWDRCIEDYIATYLDILRKRSPLALGLASSDTPQAGRL
ncbi:glycosyltransferase [Caldimonas tepidiphila]|uniref:glycosyltransferase n=1 Tax=Caldimonas tepidiphila TaxID=2315841 RepID=UPI001300780B|nr:glycosyltransferase [Caldimonas tepidiphila]